MGFELIYNTDSGNILLMRRTAAPRDDLTPGEGEGKVFLQSLDLGDRPVSAFRVDPERGTFELRNDYVEPETGVRLRLTAHGADASPIDVSPIDGIHSIPADGKATAIITVQKQAMATGRDLKRVRDNNVLNVRTSAGTLSMRQVRLERGKQDFTLTSSTETVVAEVRVWSEDIPGAATLDIEFAPTARDNGSNGSD